MSSLLALPLASPVAAAHHHKAAAPDASVASKDAPLQYTRLGKGPAVVFLHGLGGDRAVWAQEILRLSPKYTVVAIDLPGHGQSAAPALISAATAAGAAPAAGGKGAAPAAGNKGEAPAGTMVDLPKVAEQVAKLIRAEHLAPAVIVGHSLGGQVAAWVPLVDREAVRGVLLVDAPLSPLTMSDSERTRLRSDMKRDAISTLRRFYAPITTGTPQLDRVVAAAQRVPAASFMGYVDYVVGSDTLEERAREIAVPVHLLAGPLLIANNNDAAKAKLSLQAAGFNGIPAFTYEYFPSSKHWLFWDEPERFRDSLDRFLGQVTRPAVSATKSRTRL